MSTPNGDVAVFQYGVAEDAEIRRANFRRLWKEPFSPSEAKAALGWGSASQWSDLYHGPKTFGEKLARKIEDRLGLVRLSLDDEGGPKVAAISSDVMEALKAAPDEVQDQADAVLRALLGLGARPVVRHRKPRGSA